MRVVDDGRLNDMFLSKFKGFFEIDLLGSSAHKFVVWCFARYDGSCAYAVPDPNGDWKFQNPDGVWDFSYRQHGSVAVFAFEDANTAENVAIEMKLTFGNAIRLVEVE